MNTLYRHFRRFSVWSVWLGLDGNQTWNSQTLQGEDGSVVADLSLRYKRPNIIPPVVPINTNLGKSRASVCNCSLQYSLRIQLFSAQGLSELDVSVCAVVLNRFLFPWACFCLVLKTWHNDRWPAISSDHVHTSQKTVNPRDKQYLLINAHELQKVEKIMSEAPFLKSCSCMEQFQLQGDYSGNLKTVELRDQSIWWLTCRK